MNAVASSLTSQPPVEHADHAYVVDGDGVITAVSDDLLALLGYPRDELLGKYYLDVVSPTYLATSRRQFERKALGEAAATEEMTELLAHDGRPVLLAIKSFRLPQRDDSVLIVGVATEIGTPPHVELASGDAVIGIGDDMRVVGWNAASEQLTGRPAREALGRPCWEVLSAVDELGQPICGPGCRLAERASNGGDLTRLPIRLATPRGERRLTLSTVSAQLGAGRLVMHLLPTGGGEGGTLLTVRQHEVLTLLDEGLTTAAIARRLVLSKTTVRNHIQAILRALACHSRLEAVVEGRRLGLL